MTLEITADHRRVIPGARLCERENLHAHLDLLPAAFRTHGLPLALDIDCHSFFFTSTPDALTPLAADDPFSKNEIRSFFDA